MLVLLPPSETKAAPARRGSPVDLERLSYPELADLRKRVLAGLIEASADPRALELLGVGASLAAEVGSILDVVLPAGAVPGPEPDAGSGPEE